MPSEEPDPTSPLPSPSPESSPAHTPPPLTDVTGVWTTTDEQGQVFDIVIFANGQVVTNWTKGKEGAYGERGLWHKDGNKLLVFYHDGSSDMMEASAEGVRYTGLAPGATMDSPPRSTATARRLPDTEAKFLGIWRLNKEPDGSYQYLALQSNGRAFSSVNGGTEGKWSANGDAAECIWPDGWVDRLELTPDGWQKRSTIGSGTDTPADISQAIRVGETRFEIVP